MGDGSSAAFVPQWPNYSESFREQAAAARKSDRRSAARGMPHTRDLYQLLLDIYAINNSIWSKNNFADLRVPVFWNDTTGFRLFLQDVGASHQFVSERFCTRRIVTRNKTNDVAQIVTRNGRPDQLASHLASCRLTSSCGMPSPRSS